MTSSGLCAHLVCKWYVHIHANTQHLKINLERTDLFTKGQNQINKSLSSAIWINSTTTHQPLKQKMWESFLILAPCLKHWQVLWLHPHKNLKFTHFSSHDIWFKVAASHWATAHQVVSCSCLPHCYPHRVTVILRHRNGSCPTLHSFPLCIQ